MDRPSRALRQGEFTSEIGSELPSLVDVHTREFQEWFGDKLAFHTKVFPSQESHSPSHLPPPRPKDIPRVLEGNNAERRSFFLELATLLQEYEANSDVMNGDKLWEHQKALLIEFLYKLIQRQDQFRGPPDSYLFNEATGSGKTRLLGVLIGTLSRMMVRGVFEGNVLVLVKRKVFVLQQAFSERERRALLLDRPGSREWNTALRAEHTFIEQELDHAQHEFFPRALWMELRRSRMRSPVAAEKFLRSSLQERKLLDAFEAMPNHEEILQRLSALAAQRARIIMAPNEHDLEVLELSPPKPERERHQRTGDLVFQIHPQIHEKGQLFAQTEFDMESADTRMPTEQTRIAILSRHSIMQHKTRLRLRAFLEPVAWAFTDEAGLRSAHEYGGIGTSPGLDGQEASVVAATAFKRKHQRYDAELSPFSVENGINGPDKVIQDHRLLGFPVHGEPFFPCGSYEALEQLVDIYGRLIDLIQKGHVLTIVNRNQVEHLIIRLKQAYGDRGVHFLSLHANRHERHNASVQVRMNDPADALTCAVGSLGSAIDSFDWRRLRATIFAVHENSPDMEFMKRAYGRQFHTIIPGGYIVFERFADEDARNRVPWLAYEPDIAIPPAGPFEVIPGQYFLGKDACAKEAKELRRTRLKKDILWSVSALPEYQELFPTFEGTMPQRRYRDQPATAISDVIHFPPLIEGAIDDAYIRAFALRNDLLGSEDNLWNAVHHRTQEPLHAQAAALRKAALAIRWEPVTEIAEKARANIAAAKKKCQRLSLKQLNEHRKRVLEAAEQAVPGISKRMQTRWQIPPSRKHRGAHIDEECTEEDATLPETALSDETAVVEEEVDLDLLEPSDEALFEIARKRKRR